MSKELRWPYAPGTAPAVGTALQVEEGTDTMPLAATNSLDPRNAAALTLRRFLECARFVVDGGNGRDKPFRLAAIHDRWPRHDEGIKYPAASIVEVPQADVQAFSLVPVPLEQTYGVFAPATVLWKTDELSVEFQVDFWANEDPHLEAIAAHLPALFNPGEGRAGVMLSGPADYFSAPVRATLVSQPVREVDGDGATVRERRLRCLVLCDVDVLHLRRASLLEPRVIWKDYPEEE